jgi:hypothetical protein
MNKGKLFRKGRAQSQGSKVLKEAKIAWLPPRRQKALFPKKKGFLSDKGDSPEELPPKLECEWMEG